MKFYYVPVLAAAVLLSACSDGGSEKTSGDAPAEISAGIENKIFSFNLQNAVEDCREDSGMVCAVNLALRCTIKPDAPFCQDNKDKMPSFIFMNDESLGRPSEITYQILKLKPLPNGQVEMYTRGSCNGKWFGLCQGNIIYVMRQQNGTWAVDDIYAMESY